MLSEETKDARRVIAITVLAAVGIIIGYFVVVVYAEAISYGLKDANEVWPTDPTPLFRYVRNASMIVMRHSPQCAWRLPG